MVLSLDWIDTSLMVAIIGTVGTIAQLKPRQKNTRLALWVCLTLTILVSALRSRKTDPPASTAAASPAAELPRPREPADPTRPESRRDLSPLPPERPVEDRLGIPGPEPRRDPSALPPPPKPATGTLVLDLLEDVSAGWEVLLDGQMQAPAFSARRALGFVVPVGVRELRVRRCSREFARRVFVREGTQTGVVVSFPRPRLLLEFLEDVPDGVEVRIDDRLTRPISQGRRCCEVEVDAGMRDVLVRHRGREFRRTVVVGEERTPPLTVDLGAERPPPPRVDPPRLPSPVPRPRPAMRVYTPLEVWRSGSRLSGQRIRVCGPGKVWTTIDGGFLIRFHDDSRILVHCTIPSYRGEPLKGKVRDGEGRDLTLEGVVGGRTEDVMAMSDGEVIAFDDPPDDQMPNSDPLARKREEDAAVRGLTFARLLENASREEQVNGNIAEAQRLRKASRDTLRDVIKNYPTTKGAEEAKELLDR